MHWLLRVFAEFRDPDLKCRRVGHARKIRAYRGLENKRGYRTVADLVYGEILACPRCGIRFDRTVTFREGQNSISLDLEDNRRLVEHGFVEL